MSIKFTCEVQRHASSTHAGIARVRGDRAGTQPHKAAQSLHLTHGAISHQIKALESDLGVRLVERAGRGIRVTEDGERFAARVRTAFAELMTAVQEITNRANPRQLRVSISPSLAARWLLPRIGRFHAEHPDIDLVVNSSMAIVDFQRDEDDVAIRNGRHCPACASSTWWTSVFPVCSPRIAGGCKRPADLARYKLLRADGEPWNRGSRRPARLARADRGPDFSVRSSDAAAAEGHGIASAACTLLGSDVAQGAGPALRFETPTRADGPVYPPRNADSAKNRRHSARG